MIRFGLFLVSQLPFVIVFLFLAGCMLSAFISPTKSGRAHSYVPTPGVSNLAFSASMTEKAELLFYTKAPRIVFDKQEIRNICRDHSDSILLGCYNPRENRIFIFDTEDSEFEGVSVVIAAHELLHAVYGGLSRAEKKLLDSQIQNFVAQNPEIKNMILNRYPNKDIDTIANELHSILGTEVESLPGDLERHYANYFSGRKRLVILHDRMQSVFDKATARLKFYDVALLDLDSKLRPLKGRIAEMSQDIDAGQSELVNLKNRGEIELYNQLLPEFNSRIALFRSVVEEANGLVTKHNRLVRNRNSAAREARDSIAPIDTREMTAISNNRYAPLRSGTK